MISPIVRSGRLRQLIAMGRDVRYEPGVALFLFYSFFKHNYNIVTLFFFYYFTHIRINRQFVPAIA